MQVNWIIFLTLRKKHSCNFAISLHIFAELFFVSKMVGTKYAAMCSKPGCSLLHLQFSILQA
jgi:hypothetical protein